MSSYIDFMYKEAEELARRSGYNSIMSRAAGQGTGFTTMSALTEMMSVLSSQNNLIMRLLSSQNQLQMKYGGIFISSESGSGNDNPRNQLNPSQSQEPSSSGSRGTPPIPEKRINLVTFPKPLRVARQQRFSQVSQQDQDAMSDFKDDRADKPKQPETKNMIKNFAKAIFSYINKHPEARARVLASQGMQEAQFMLIIARNKGRVHSIAELRSLWTRKDSFGRVFRILSNDYLRKHCLQRTFNSRVENYAVHLKYRHRLLEGIKRPQDFTSLKID